MVSTNYYKNRYLIDKIGDRSNRYFQFDLSNESIFGLSTMCFARSTVCECVTLCFVAATRTSSSDSDCFSDTATITVIFAIRSRACHIQVIVGLTKRLCVIGCFRGSFTKRCTTSFVRNFCRVTTINLNIWSTALRIGVVFTTNSTTLQFCHLKTTPDA